MKLDCFEEVKRLTSELVAIPASTRRRTVRRPWLVMCTITIWACLIFRRTGAGAVLPDEG